MMAAMAAAEAAPAEAPAEEAPVDVDAMMAAMAAAEGAPAETPAEEAPVDVDAMMAAMAAAEAAPVEAPAEAAPAEMDAVMAAMAAAEAAPAEEPAHESPAENLDAILNAEIAAMSASTEPATEIPADIDPVAAAMMAAEAEAQAQAQAAESVVEITEPVSFDEEPEQTPAEMDMGAASDAMEGAVEDIEDFLSSEDYEYTLVKTGDNTLILMKTADGNSMAICYEGNEFDSLEPDYCKDGKTSYKDIMNSFVKEIIKNGGSSRILRHKGSKVVAK
jgi:hypothetical protein